MTSHTLKKNFDELKDLITWEDYDAWIKFSKLNEEFVKLPGILGYIKIDDENPFFDRMPSADLIETSSNTTNIIVRLGNMGS